MSIVKKIILSVAVQFYILSTLPAKTFGQITGELVDIQYPSALSAGEQLSVTMTVTNTGLGTWVNVCSYVGYVLNDEPVLTLCPNLGMLEPGDSATYTCSTESGILGTPDRSWSGIGFPFG